MTDLISFYKLFFIFGMFGLICLLILFYYVCKICIPIIMEKEIEK